MVKMVNFILFICLFNHDFLKILGRAWLRGSLGYHQAYGQIPGKGVSRDPLWWAFQLAQWVKKPLAMQETWIQFPGSGRSLGAGHGNPL